MLGRDKIGEWFETGDRPTAKQFIEKDKSFINMVDDDMFADGNKNIGIGTDDPDTKLHINGTDSNEDEEGVLKIAGSSGTVGTNLRLGVNPNYSWIQSHGAKPLKINPSTFGNDVIINEKAGNAGIGVSNPTSKLHINGDVRINDSKLHLRTNDSNTGLSYEANYNDFLSGANVAVDGAVLYGNKGGLLVANESGNQKVALRWDNQGRVGIGLDYNTYHRPMNILHVHNSTGNDTGICLSKNAGNNKVLVSDSSGNASWKALTDRGLAGDSLIPTGVIVMWSGNILLIPTGWDLCDGKNGTPDLKGRFIVGYDATDTDYDYSNGKEGPPHINTSDYTLEENGKRVVLKEGAIPKHKHYVNLPTSDAGRHRHSLKEIDETTGWGSKHGFAATAYAKQSTYNTDYQEDHNHKVTGDTNSQGRDQSHENRPPYYVLAFIIKI